MRNLFIPISIGLLCTSFTIIPGKNIATKPPMPNAGLLASYTNLVTLYQNSHLSEHGLSFQAFEYAWKGYEELLMQNKISKQQYLTICDFSQSSACKRLYVIDISNNKLLINTYVAHGRNSGGVYATHFSNTPESLESSLGFYITDQTYNGAHGLSLRLKGMEDGFNDNAYTRSIVIHGADYVDGARAKSNVMMGRSFGCPAVPKKESTNIINTIKNGSCLFIYHPSKDYILKSKLLNG
ncbi:MAG: murein L,D-transpeptidase catalytic domain family protein [Bacteroidetes bacterium]|nr:murein L,D-transpeptidase catalytic domain family protein [Bacteroidota bacterium]